jgi:hypothetical protein
MKNSGFILRIIEKYYEKTKCTVMCRCKNIKKIGGKKTWARKEITLRFYLKGPEVEM